MPNSSQEDIDKVIEELKKKCSVVNWGRLRFIGSLRILSVIPFVGAGIVTILGLPQFSSVNAKKLLEDIWIIGSLMTFLISLFSANVIYHIACPPVIKKFETLADLYREQLLIKKSQMETYPNDKFEADLLHITKFYFENLSKCWVARWGSLLLFSLSLIALFCFLYNFRALLIDP